eukprot:m.74105 g.74105  ORF g.74105 m.74105 type:complete len:489 (-) comp13068_c0_seq3:127-1593(-)
MVFWLLVFAWIALLLVFIDRRQRKTFSPNAARVEPQYPILGNSLLVAQFLPQMLDLMMEQVTKLKRTYQFKVLGQPTYIGIFQPANLEHVLSKNFDNYIKGDFFREKFYDLLGDGIFDVDGEEWAFQRKTASHIFTRNELRGFMTDVFQDHAHLVVERLERAAAANALVEVQDLFYRYTLESIGKIAFGINLGCFERDKVDFAIAFDEAQQLVLERATSPLWAIRKHIKFLHPAERRLAACVKMLNGFAEKVIRERRLEPDLDRKEDLLSRFMAVRDPAGQPLSDPYLRDIIMSFVIAGRDTTANALSWLFDELTQRPEVMDKLVDEIDTVLQGNTPTYEDVETRMPYLTGCVKETLRLHPSVAKDAKLAVNDDVLPDGTIIPAGACVVYLPWAMGRLEELWPEPLAFRPERWIGAEQVSHFKFPAFNAGPRLCLGMNMAYVEAKILTATILQKFAVARAPGQKTTYAITLTLPLLQGLQCSFKLRAQ